MIFITVGTQPQLFTRLFKKIEELIDNGEINDEIIAQVGLNVVNNDKIKCFSYLEMTEMRRFIKAADLIISHGGAGSIITALKMGKKVIGIPRLSKYGEHINDHQIDLINALSNENYIIPLYNIDLLKDAIEKSYNFNPKPFKSGQEEIIKDIKFFIDKIDI